MYVCYIQFPFIVLLQLHIPPFAGMQAFHVCTTLNALRSRALFSYFFVVGVSSSDAVPVVMPQHLHSCHLKKYTIIGTSYTKWEMHTKHESTNAFLGCLMTFFIIQQYTHLCEFWVEHSNVKCIFIIRFCFGEKPPKSTVLAESHQLTS